MLRSVCLGPYLSRSPIPLSRPLSPATPSPPQNPSLAPCHVSVLRYVVEQRRDLLCAQHHRWIARAQARMRGFLVRKWMAYCRWVKARYDNAVSTLQRFWRGRVAQARAQARCQRLRRQRSPGNTFAHAYVHPHRLLAAAEDIAWRHYSLCDPRAGLRLTDFLARLVRSAPPLPLALSLTALPTLPHASLPRPFGMPRPAPLLLLFCWWPFPWLLHLPRGPALRCISHNPSSHTPHPPPSVFV